METEEAELCFPTFNNSCKKMMRSHVEATIIYTFLSFVTLFTVVLNLLVIISISHFRKLQTTTNLILLSLAFSDFLVGFLQMPFQILHYQGCWLLGDFVCALYCFSDFIIVSVSVGNMVLISIDRYVAICDPMLYPTKVTVKRVQLCIYLCWIFSAVHATWVLRDLLKQPDRFNSCYGECILLTNYAEGVFDLVVTFLGPIIIIIVLYMRVFVVAVSQARAMRTHIASVKHQCSGTVTTLKSEMKAARTLGVVVVVFLSCFCPSYGLALANANDFMGSSTADYEIWLVYINSCLNPLIYAFCYPWFRKCVKHIVTLHILQPESREANIQ